MGYSVAQQRQAMHSDTLWPGRPALLPGEAFSSWFARTAATNGLTPVKLYSAALPGAYRYTRDLDRYVEPHLLDSLAEHTGVPKQWLLGSTLARWAGKIFDLDDGLGKLQWLPVAGGDDGQRSFGQQVCPACLREDAQPYLRATWRVAFVTTCDRHRQQLIDRCPECGEAIQVLRAGLDGDVRCWKCQADLRHSRTNAAQDDSDIRRQNRLLDIANAGWTELEHYGPVYSFVYFRILTIAFRLLATGRHAAPLRAWCEIFQPSTDGTPAVPRIRQIELLNARSRRELIRMAVFLLEDWPVRFIQACQCVGLSSRDLLKAGRTRPYPFAFAHAVEMNLSSQFRAISADELESAKSYLNAQEVPPTYRALANLLGVKITAHRALAEPAAHAPSARVAEPNLLSAAPWGEGRYWKLDGISPEVKAAARIAARRAGEGVGAWLENLLRQELGMPARKTPHARQSPDTFPADGIFGCAE